MPRSGSLVGDACGEEATPAGGDDRRVRSCASSRYARPAVEVENRASAREGRVRYRRHRIRERSPVLRQMKKEQVLTETGRLACEVCGFDYAARYGSLGDGFIECHHTTALAEGEERDATLD